MCAFAGQTLCAIIPLEMLKLAINGFGRIGRAAFRAAQRDPSVLGERLRPSLRLDTSGMEVVAVNDLTGGETLASLLKYDSVYGLASASISVDESQLVVSAGRVKLFCEAEPTNLPWGELGIDVVLECSGAFADFERARAHLEAGAKRVIISANAKGGGPTVVLGTDSVGRLGSLAAAQPVLSMASCTTNCIAPVMQILKDEFGVEKSLMTTIHAYTSTQNLVDGSNEDPRRARAAAVNVVPTTTGAARAAGRVVSGLEEKFDGIAVRVPVACASLADMTVLLGKETTAEEVNRIFKKASAADGYRGITEYSEAPLVSTDIIGNSHSAVVDAPFTRVVGGNLVKILAWYDNEWAYGCRLIELAQMVGKGVA